MEEKVYQQDSGREFVFVDCIKCDEIKEVESFSISRICLACGQENFVSPIR